MKKIALIMDGWRRYFTYAWPSGILAKIKELKADINLYIFNSAGNWSNDGLYNEGEYNIFRLPDLTDFDGIILDLNNIREEAIREEVILRVKQAKVPTIAIGNIYEDFYYVGIDNYAAMKGMVEHLHTKHQCQSYWCIMGPEDNYENIQRMQAVQDYFKEQEFAREDYAFYCASFEYQSGVEGFHTLFEQYNKMPDAIVCANDNIAVGVLAAAEKFGLTAPENFLITGFDDFDKARYYDPRITTVGHIREDVGYLCVEIFIQLWQGKKLPRFHYTKTRNFFWESCGCIPRRYIDEREHLKGEILYSIEMTSFEEQVLALEYELLRCKNLREMMECIPLCIPSLKCDAMYLVTDKRMEGIQEHSNIAEMIDIEGQFLVKGYPKDMTLVFSYDKYSGEKKDSKTKVADIFPMFDCKEGGVDFLFLPIHFRNHCVGYLVIRNAIYLMQKQFLFQIVNVLTTAMENLYKKEKLEYMNKELSDLYVHDSMTLLYNRLGFSQLANKQFEQKKKEKKNLLIMYLDLDRLKYINDTFGHDKGDVAIRTVAAAIRNHMSAEGSAFRLGGDEFLVIEDALSKDAIQAKVEAMQQELKVNSESSAFPIEITISIGYIVTDMNSDTSLEEYVNMADNIMYQHKAQRKMERRN